MKEKKVLNKIGRMGINLGIIYRILRARFIGNQPLLISHLITSRCQADCPFCLWKGSIPEEQDTNKVINFYQQAKKSRFISAVFWGGEPLMREDMCEIIEQCNKLGLITGLITNGYYLPEYAYRLAHNLGYLIVSIDIPSQEHDRIRKVKGLFDRAIYGIKEIKQRNPDLKVFINTVISEITYPHALEAANLAAQMKLTVTFESVNKGRPRFQPQAPEINFRLAPEKEKEAFKRILRLKKQGMPINNSDPYLELFAKGNVKYRCQAPKIRLTIYPNGDVDNCLDGNNSLGNVYKQSLKEILVNPQLKELKNKAVNCSRCVGSGTIEPNFLWNFNPEGWLNSFKRYMMNP